VSARRPSKPLLHGYMCFASCFNLTISKKGRRHVYLFSGFGSLAEFPKCDLNVVDKMIKTTAGRGYGAYHTTILSSYMQRGDLEMV
jgi:hypothetical protein